MSGDNVNRRGSMTRMSFRNALVELTEQRGYDAVTVGDIAERANVTRTAFYRHYRDKQDLIEGIFSDTLGMIVQADACSVEERAPQLRMLFDRVAENERLFRAFLGPGGSAWFDCEIQELASPLSCLVCQCTSSTYAWIKSAVGGILTNTIVWWLDNGRTISADQLVAIYLRVEKAVIVRIAAVDDRF
ncbi:TetR family transcriptional regulator [Nocardia sp. BSTN01]|uniref:TetR/AcrR family transcriptional regulator n=1 Tax=Nocardia sp. BSTN01 TaxID=2783665 RepID=UPI00188DF1CE|nr:TetR family transcriptional regulator [Nocardia sp. BSTN01]MBF4998073.1 TetR family transcriptional regulator [Nocardia sp. BSTN01]